MKKIITLDTIVASLFGAIGYGAGYVIPTSYGVNALFSFIICMAAGTICDKAGDRLIFNKSVQKDIGKKHLVFAGSVLIFIAAYFAVAKVFAHSLFSDLGSQLFYIIVMPVISFGISLGIRFLKKKRLLKKYGSGESGFVFDKEAEDAMKALKGENRELPGYTGKDPAVKTFGGTYVGKRGRNGISFLGIPYASAERWRRPVPAAASEKIYEAYYFGASEIQPENSHNILTHFKQSEDCLSLNIWMSKLEPEAKKPVLVYFHGGDGRYGGSASPVYHMENLAKSIPDAVFVSINYRFGLFGVVDFASSGCSDAGEYEGSTALSLLDQIEALKWVKANIALFGGDPENITAAGDNSGGSCICMLAAMKEAKGLFKRALILCACTSDSPLGNDKALELGKMLKEEFRAEKAADLKTVTEEQLRDFSNRHYDLLELPPQDGRIVPLSMEKAYLNGAAADIEFIIGIAADDVSGWQARLAGKVSLDELAAAYYEMLKKVLGAEKAGGLDAILEKYIESGLSIADAKGYLLSDFHYLAGPLHDCRTLTKGGSTVRCFYWDVNGDIEKLTANAVSLVTSIFGNSEIAEQMGYLNDLNITEITQAFVEKFIHAKPLEFFNNELKGVREITWDIFDADRENILHVQKDSIQMTETIVSENVRELEKLVFGK